MSDVSNVHKFKLNKIDHLVHKPKTFYNLPILRGIISPFYEGYEIQLFALKVIMASENYFFRGNVQDILHAISEVTPIMCISGSAVLAEALYRVGHRGSDLYLPNDVDIFIPAWSASGELWNVDDVNAYLEQTFTFLYKKGFEVKCHRIKFQEQGNKADDLSHPYKSMVSIFSIIEFEVKLHQPQPAVPIDRDVTYQMIFMKNLASIQRTFGKSVVSGIDFNVVQGIYNPRDQKISFPTEDANSVHIVEFLCEKVFVCYLHACKNRCFHG